MPPADVQYVGEPGCSQECLHAILRFLQFGDRISKARLLTCVDKVRCTAQHCFLLTVNETEKVVVRSGFTSGYLGEGPRTLSRALAVLEAFGAEIEEVDVPEEIIDAIDSASMSIAMLKRLDGFRRARPSRVHDYREHWDPAVGDRARVLSDFCPVIPYEVVEPRVIDLALTFWDTPNDRLITGFKRLEDQLRKRTGLQEVGVRLLSDTFRGKPPKLTWPQLLDTESEGRVNLFIGTFMAYRNPRAHNERTSSPQELLWEFMLINQLFKYEAEAL